jgi:hypothetical protein
MEIEAMFCDASYERRLMKWLLPSMMMKEETNGSGAKRRHVFFCSLTRTLSTRCDIHTCNNPRDPEERASLHDAAHV